MTIAFEVGFHDGAVRQHLARLAIMDQAGYAGSRREIGEYLIGEVQDALDGQRLADGSPMPQSQAARDRKGKTLIERRHLYDSYVYQLVPGGVEVGSSSVYAAIHHFGGETGRKSRRFTLAARPVLGLTTEREQRIGDILIDELKRAIR